MDHVIQLRQEVAACKRYAVARVTDAVGQASVRCIQCFKATPSNFSTNFRHKSRWEWLLISVSYSNQRWTQEVPVLRLYIPQYTVLLTAKVKNPRLGYTWQKNDPGVGRSWYQSSAIHLGWGYLRGLDPGWWIPTILEWYYPIPWLVWYTSLVRRPLRPDWYHLRSDDREVAYVWSTEHIRRLSWLDWWNWVKVIADFKTSNAPYMNRFPDRGDKMGFGGFRKYQKVPANGRLSAGSEEGPDSSVM